MVVETVTPTVETVENKADDEDVEIVGSTAGRGITRATTEALKKNRSVLG